MTGGTVDEEFVVADDDDVEISLFPSTDGEDDEFDGDDRDPLAPLENNP